MRGQTTSTTKMVLAGLVAGTLVVAGALGAGAAGRAATPAEAPTPRSAGTASPTESVFVPITPCRLVNTQNSAGDIAADELRSYKTTGNTSAQGGALDCGIPASATAIELSVTAVSAKGPGYLRVHPAGGATPTATFLNYGPGQNLTNAGTVQVRPGSDQPNLSVRAFRSDTHVVIDALGYYVSELFAVVRSTGVLERGNGSTLVEKAGTGAYRVFFDRDVTGCAYTGGLNSPGDGSGAAGHIAMAWLSGHADGVFVQTSNAAGTTVDQAFHLVVDC